MRTFEQAMLIVVTGKIVHLFDNGWFVIAGSDLEQDLMADGYLVKLTLSPDTREQPIGPEMER